MGDETAAALVRDDRTVLAEAVLSQLDEHRPYGGVVPEIAARAHLDHLDGLIARVMHESGIGFAGIDGVAATARSAAHTSELQSLMRSSYAVFCLQKKQTTSHI